MKRAKSTLTLTAPCLWFVRAHVETQSGCIVLERGSAYAPEMNPLECTGVLPIITP